ncbi:PID-CTERM protein-sorting domain-containing protein [Flavobacterium sp.]|uniref:PID-CTERM protein-sorting domain-containing protein n=1 Tax=Flavobacterium sp. TaxID=239 RepID=UPI00286E8F10|nr:hypothetical protein [Flavobacterium sp.]
MKIYSKKINVLLLALLPALMTYAAPGGPPPPTPPPPPGLPVDGFVVVLLIVGLIYGFYSIKKFKLQSK